MGASSGNRLLCRRHGGCRLARVVAGDDCHHADLSQPQGTFLAGCAAGGGALIAAGVAVWQARLTRATTEKQIELARTANAAQIERQDTQLQQARDATAAQLERQDQQLHQAQQQLDGQQLDARIRRDREQLAERRGRFTTAADQMGSDQPAVRIAGILAMAAVADAWQTLADAAQAHEDRVNRYAYTTEVQACVDVLCAYMRLPFPVGSEADSEVRVREILVRTVSRRLREGTHPSWSRNLTFDFSDADLRGNLDFSWVVLGKRVPDAVQPKRAACVMRDGLHSSRGSSSRTRRSGRGIVGVHQDRVPAGQPCSADGGARQNGAPVAGPLHA